MLHGLNMISRKQTQATELTNKWASWILDYVATHPDLHIQYYASDIKLKVHSNASYLNEDEARSSYGGYYFLGWQQPDDEALILNRAVDVAVSLLKLVAASAAEAELGGLF